MPNLGVAEIVAILVVALVVLGPKRLPEVGRKVGGFVRELRSHSESVKAELRDVIDIDGVAESVNSVRRDLKEATNITSVFTETPSNLPQTRPTAPPLPGGIPAATGSDADGDDTHPMMRVFQGEGSGAPTDDEVATPKGPTRRLPGVPVPEADPSGTGNGDAKGAGEAVTRRLPGGGDPA
ncbi:MAG: Sec-independent protein translocase protein TatB [Acidimicrobiia bacterium]